MDIATSLRQRRLAVGVSQAKLAQDIGISRITVARIETKAHAPLTTTAEEVAQALGSSFVLVPNDKLADVKALLDMPEQHKPRQASDANAQP